MFITKYDTFRTFCSKIQYFLGVLDHNQILFQCFEQNFYNFRMICTKITLFSNILDRNSIYFCMFWTKNRYLIILRTNTNISNVLREHPIIFECFQQKSDTFEMFWVEVWLFSNVLYLMWYFSNVLLKNSILFGHFGSKSDTYSLFWTKLWYFSNDL